MAGKVDLESGVPDPPNVSVDPVIRDCPGDIDPAEEILRDIVVVLDLDIQYPADLGVQTEIDGFRAETERMEAMKPEPPRKDAA